MPSPRLFHGCIAHGNVKNLGGNEMFWGKIVINVIKKLDYLIKLIEF